MRSNYDAPEYWARIYDQAYDERAVGYPHLARSINRARYDVERQNVSRALELAHVSRPHRVLDIGCGTGIWIDFWRQRGAAQIVGVDLVDASVQRLRKRYPEFEFIREDVADPDAALPSGMDIVSAMSVLLHITSDERFERGLRNILRCVGEGGTLVLVEPAVVHNWWGPPFSLEANSRTRPLSTYTRILADAGFCIVHLRPASCLLGNVIDTRHAASFRVLERQWELLSFIVGQRELVGRVAASVLRPLDLVATRLVSGGPSAKVMVVRRSEAPHKGS